MSGQSMDEQLGLISVSTDTSHGQACVLRVGGEVDISNVSALRRAWDAVLATRRPRLKTMIIDVEEVTFFGSSGLAALIECQHLAGEEGLEFRVSGTSPAVIRPLAGTGLDRCFDWYPTVDEALAGRDGG